VIVQTIIRSVKKGAKEMNRMKRRAILITAVCVTMGNVQGMDLEGEGVGTKILVPIFKADDMSGAAKMALKERRGILAGAGLSTFL